MTVAGIIHGSFIDYPGYVASVVFFKGCNFRCPACHARSLLESRNAIDIDQLCALIKRKRSWLQGIVLCGGEPTICNRLVDYIHTLRQSGLPIKLDTNGSNPDMLEQLLEKNLIDYVAMDLKSSPPLYDLATGVDVNIDFIEASIQLVQRFPHYEFRTTVVPIKDNVPNAPYRYLDQYDIENIVNWLIAVTGHNNHSYYLQKFVPRQDELIDSTLESFAELSKDDLEQIYKHVSPLLTSVSLRY